MALLWASWLVLTWMPSSTATPTIALPFNSQVPPVARVGEPFEFTLSSSTFLSDTTITYSLSNAPAWLSLDPGTRTLSGTPGDEDAETAPVVAIIGTDATGSVSMSATLVVRSNPAPVINIPLSQQISAFGAYSLPSSILLHPSTRFNIRFSPETFKQNDSSSGLNYYSVTTDNTPLPSWVYFDGSSLSFTGTTPASDAIEPPQTFGVQLTASDTLGFGGAYISFSFVIDNHILTWSQSNTTINTTGPIDYTGLANTLLLDGTPASSSSISSINTTAPDWLGFDNSTFALSGTPPADANSFTFQISARDIYGDIANASVYVNISTSLFSQTIPSLNATGDTVFSVNLTDYFTNPSDVRVSASISPQTSWLAFNSQTLVLSGSVPATSQTSTIQVTLSATSITSGRTQSENFKLNVMPNLPATTLTTSYRAATSSSASSSAATSHTEPVVSSHSSKKLSGGSIAAIVICIFLAIMILLTLCYFYRRRKQQTHSRTPSKEDISGPIVVTTLQGMTLSEKPSMSSVDVHDGNGIFIPGDQNKLEEKSMLNKKRRSQSFSGVTVYNAETLRESTGSNNRTRSFTDTDVSQAHRSTLAFQDSAYPKFERVSRISSAPAPGTAVTTGRRENSQSPYRPRKPTGAPNQRPRSSSKSSIQDTPDFAYDSAYIKSRKSTIEGNRAAAERRVPHPLTSHPHSGRQSYETSNFPTGEEIARVRRQSAGLGHGTFRLPPHETHPAFRSAISRDTSSWLTMMSDNDTERRSLISIVTASTDILNAIEGHRVSIRAVPPSPAAPPVPEAPELLVANYSLKRPVSRRAPGQAGFFGDPTTPPSRRSTKSAGSHTDPSAKRSFSSPTRSSRVPLPLHATHATLASSIMQELRSAQSSSDAGPPILSPRDAFGISYGSAFESTRQLQSYISGFRNSMESDESESRFDSAEELMEQDSDGEQRRMSYEPSYAGDEEDVLVSGNRRKMRSIYQPPLYFRDDEGQIVERGPSVALQHRRSNSVEMEASRKSSPTIEARLRPGAGKRPMSYDSSMRHQRSQTAVNVQSTTLERMDSGSAFI